ncbi:AraC family transcriptional regulator [Paenibacillus albicereus]|uniref:AraC family transcriptional regulator n=1 Tax=Paenibacillus albicereus TaxID=2726185 RepID=A0A6H2GZS6_9BACL|nr:AraC family transcriptional regulator [Paenibacillus albicereus]QJC52608.1 AraC family transcriptional regulator [Paenibacillus albicereus]
MQRQAHLLTLPEQPYFILPESVGAYRDYPEHEVVRESGALNNFNIHFVVSGKGYVRTEAGLQELTQGQAVLYFPHSAQQYGSSKDDPWEVRWIHFYGGRLRDYMIERGFHQNLLWKLRQPLAWIEAHQALLEEAETSSMTRPALLSTLAYGVLAEFVQQAVPLGSPSASPAEERILSLLPLLEEEAAKPFVLQEWAERAGVSPHYFCRLFKGALDMTPSGFVTRARLQRAKQWLLERREANIGEIAEEAGYPSASYFNKRFQEHEGMTPTEYRKLFRG